MIRQCSGSWIILFSFVVAYILALIPLPAWAAFYRPEWVVLVLIYWCLSLPKRIGIVISWLVGLMMDVLTGAVLGQHALALIVVAYITLRWHRRIRLQTIWQQALNVLFLVILAQLLKVWVHGMGGHVMNGWRFWMSAVTSMLLWPWLSIVLRDIQERFAIR
jgi:rod shape-determining protein MreD